MNRVRDLRQTSGWTQMQLGEKIGAARSTIAMYESEDRQLDPPTICAICDLFNVTADYLLCRSDNPLPAITDADARLLAAYHSANLRDRGLVDQILAAYMETGEMVSAVS